MSVHQEIVRRGRPPGRRRLFDDILIALHLACDVGDLPTAAELLAILGLVMRRPWLPEDPDRKHHLQALVAGHERLWELRHPT